MSIRTRLIRLEAAADHLKSDADKQNRKKQLRRRVSYEEWLSGFEQMSHEGHFEHEPDFPIALAEYRNALENAAHQSSPPFLPPADFLPDETAHQRIEEWRRTHYYPEVRSALTWLEEIRIRIQKGFSPLTAKEWSDLGHWIEKNFSRVPVAESFQPYPSEIPWLVVGANYLRYFLRGERRQKDASVMAELVRKLRTRFGDST